jgi:hypothetical protein
MDLHMFLNLVISEGADIKQFEIQELYIARGFRK